MRSHVRNGRLILTSCNSGFVPFLKNWLGGLRILGLQEFVVIALDDIVRRLLGDLGLASHVVSFGRTDAPRVATDQQPRAATSWYDLGYRRLMGSQPWRVLTIFAYGGFDVLVSDVDVAFVQSPWPVLYAPSRAHCALQGMAASQARPPGESYDTAVRVREPHPQANCPQCINAGLFFLRQGSASLRFAETWAAMLRQRRDLDHNQKVCQYPPHRPSGPASALPDRLPDRPRCAGFFFFPSSPRDWLVRLHSGSTGSWPTAGLLSALARRARPLQMGQGPPHPQPTLPTPPFRSPSHVSLGSVVYGRDCSAETLPCALPLRCSWREAPTVCQLDPRSFANGEAIRNWGLPPAPTCACAPPLVAVGRRASGRASCEGQRRRHTEQLVAAHFNFARSASDKTCMAKGVGAWLLSEVERHRSSYERHAQPAGTSETRQWLRAATAPGNTSNDFSADDGVVATFRSKKPLGNALPSTPL